MNFFITLSSVFAPGSHFLLAASCMVLTNIILH